MRSLFAYNRWATLRFLDALEALAPEELGRELASSFPSIVATLVHMLGAEWVWLERWRGTSPTDFPEAGSLDSLDALRERWDALWRDQLALLDDVGEAGLHGRLEYRTMSGARDARELGELMRHVVNHGTYHRGQLATMIRQLGHAPPATDYVAYLRQLDGA